MLPPLLKLRVDGGCRPCNAPTDAVLPTWGDREDVLTPEELARIPPSFTSSRAECAICYEQLSDPSPQDGESREVIVAVDMADSCGHAFHKKCLQHWFDEQVRNAGSLTCPFCQQPFLDKKIDALYQRVNGVRPLRPIPEVPGLLEDAENVVGPNQGRNRRLVLLEGTPQSTIIHIPNNRRFDWTVYAHEEFCRRWQIDPFRLTLNTFLRIIQLPDVREQNRWLSYHILVRNLAEIQRDNRSEVAAVYGIVAIARYVRGARAGGASWREVVMALAFGPPTMGW